MAAQIDSFEKELEKFGLSDKQAKIYLLLVEHKELRIGQITELAGIPRSSVYESLKGLYEMGIAEEIVGENHKLVRPYPIGAMHHGLDERMQLVQKLKEDLSELEKALPINQPGESIGTAVRYYKGRSGARQLYWNTLKAKDTVYVYSDWGRGRYVGMKFYETFVAESRRRQIRERVIINATPEALESIRRYTTPGSAISRTRIEDIRAIDEKVLIVRGDALIYSNIFAQVYIKNIEINGFEIENPLFVATQRQVHEAFWNLATPITELL